MRNKYLLTVLSILFLVDISSAQGICGTFQGYLAEDKQNYPEFYKSLEDKNSELEEQYQSVLSRVNNMKLGTVIENGKKIIPVVVHVIHNGTSQSNLTEAQIQNGIDHLNANINGQAWNFLSITPDVFAAVRGVANIEFRLAKIDPDGNPTNGIVRVRSSKTIVPEPRNQIKRLSYWNSYQYFNIWTVQSMPALGPDSPALNGYAQFPNSGSMSTDGVVIRAQELAQGTTIAHETGHWLGLCHTWDCGGGTCGTDNVSDTPEDLEGTFDFGNGSSFPFHVGYCIADSMNWAGEMYMNYMDYQSDAVGTMFTKGQVAVFNEHLEGVTEADPSGDSWGYREYMWQEANLIATGTYDGYKPASCMKTPDFDLFGNSSPIICKQNSVSFQGNKSVFGNGNVTSFIWDFGDGETNASGVDQINHTYEDEGVFDVSLTIEYNEITKTESQSIDVLLNLGATLIDSIITPEIVQGTQSELISMGASNIIQINIDSLGLYWGMQDSSYFRGMVNNVTYVAYFENTCNATIKKEEFIVVNSVSSNNTSSSYKYSFENETDLGVDWIVNSKEDLQNTWDFNTGKTSTWEKASGIGNDGVSCIKLKGEEMFEGSHEIISPSYDLSGFSTPAIKFSYSGAALNTYPDNNFKVWYSTDCGQSWYTTVCCELGSFNAVQTANSGLYATSFIPSPDEWSTVVLKKPQLKNDNVRFKFEYVSTEASNNFYLDNIQIGEEAALLTSSNTTLSRLSIFPNPTKGGLNLILENLSEKDVQVSLVNILGSGVKQLFDGRISNNFHQIGDIDLSILDKGVYFVKVSSNGDVVFTDKLILNK